jgi:pyruvate dehydrogenase E2 component (dihydrolipoamide acetyltransferase)
MIEFRMPSLGADMEAGTLVEWLKKPGDELRRGDIIAVVETQKGAIEIEVFDSGVLQKVLASPGEKVPVGNVLATILSESRPATPAARPAAPVEIAPGPAAPAAYGVSVAPPHPRPATARPKVTPAARQRARELGIDIALIAPGSAGIVGLSEVEKTQAKIQPSRERGIDLDEMRKAIAAAMSRSNREIPHCYVSSTLDVAPVMDWLEGENERRPVVQRLLYIVPLLKAIALALKASPELNGHHVDGTFQPAERINIGVAIALRGGGLITPAISEVDGLGLDQLMARFSDLVARVRGGRLRSSELSEGTITVSNLGERTADLMLPVIYPPQVAIVGLGQIAERPWVTGGKVLARRTITVTVAGDHRVSDGRRAAQFLTRFEELLRSPEQL